MNKYTFPIITLLIIIIAVLGFGGYFYYQNLNSDNLVSVDLDEITQREASSEAAPLEIANPIDQSIRNPLSAIQNPLEELSDDLLEATPSSPLEEVDYNPFL